MSQAEVFLTHLEREPHDDSARLVYADWLDENDQPTRAAYLRAELKLAASGEPFGSPGPAFSNWHALSDQVDAPWVCRAGIPFEVVLLGHERSRKIPVIKAIREFCGIRLLPAKLLAEKLPSVVLAYATRLGAERAARLLQFQAGDFPCPVEVARAGATRAARVNTDAFRLVVISFPPDCRATLVHDLETLTRDGQDWWEYVLDELPRTVADFASEVAARAARRGLPREATFDIRPIPGGTPSHRYHHEGPL